MSSPKKRISFIINPISGGIHKQRIPEIIKRKLDHSTFSYDIHFTDSPSHHHTLVQEAIQADYDILVAAGGDGTINQTASQLTHTGRLMGIIPLGSGNGLARHLNIPLNPSSAINVINRLHTVAIDTAKANDHFFINVAGTGFDARVSRLFATAPRRGLYSYARITLREFASYQPEEIELEIDGHIVHTRAFILCVANGSQYGNNAFIAPGADLRDGILEISVIRPFRSWQVPAIGTHLFTRRFGKSPYTETYRGREIIIRRQTPGYINIDGEAIETGTTIHIAIHPSSLHVIVP